MQILFSKEVIAAVVAGVISLISVLLTTYMNSKNKSNILKEQNHWRNDLQRIAKKLSRFISEGGRQTDLDELLTMLKVRINAYGQNSSSSTFSKDEHIWQSIKTLEKNRDVNDPLVKLELKKLIDYISLLLTHDREKADRKASLNYLEIFGFCMHVVANILFIYFAYIDFADISIFTLIILVLLLTSVFSIPLMATTTAKIARTPKVWSDINPYFIIIFGFVLLLFLNYKGDHILKSLVLPIALQMISAFLLALSNLQEILDNHRYKKEIMTISQNNKILRDYLMFTKKHPEELDGGLPRKEQQNDRQNGMVAYLQMIQEPINRMSTISAIFKGFAASIVAGIALINYDHTQKWILLLSFLLVITFALMDVYYLYLKRRFRELYKDVSTGKHIVDFSLNIQDYKYSFWSCFKSPSFYLFYPILIFILIIVCILKFTGSI